MCEGGDTRRGNRIFLKEKGGHGAAEGRALGKGGEKQRNGFVTQEQGSKALWNHGIVLVGKAL